ncbi:MAG: ABC transporter ATP-binding protein [Gammaproteobacteria bacterium]|nr:ABC transporter ATP-binding protein [Gammaproteobacteria bacterium]MDH5592496.1 ABC transporter ATP-binding protein [Gammaproteobacteria bacterium]
MKQAIVELHNLSKIYQQGEVQVKAVDNVSLTIAKGDFAALCGPSGSGKTSILNLIGGLDTATSGQVWLEGIDLESMGNTQLAEVRKNRIGFVFQSYNLIPVMTAFENAAFVLDLQGIAKQEIQQRVMQTLAQVGLTGLEHRRPDEMSGGQQQRVAIARAIVTEPAIVLADEPTANVDSHTAESLLDLMQTLNQQQGITFLFSTHDQHVIDRARRIIQVQDGQVVSDEIRP